jgi:hypothetical protein
MTAELQRVDKETHVTKLTVVSSHFATALKKGLEITVPVASKISTSVLECRFKSDGLPHILAGVWTKFHNILGRSLIGPRSKTGNRQ